MTDSIFNAEPPVTTPSSDTLTNLVGEGKKFKTVEDLAKGKLEADQFIETLKQELADLRQESATRARLEEIVDNLTSARRAEENYQEAPNHRPNESPSQPQTTQGDIERLIDQTITRREQQQTATQNRQVVKEKLKEVFGSDYVSKLETRREELGLSQSDMDSLAARSPTAFLALVAPNQGRSTPVSPPRSSVRSEALTHQNPTAAPGTWAYYEALKQSDPKKYWSPAVQGQLHKDALKASKEGRQF